MQKITLLAQASRAQPDPILWFAAHFVGATSTYERAIVVTAAISEFGSNIEFPPTKDSDQIKALVAIWLKQLPQTQEEKTFKGLVTNYLQMIPPTDLTRKETAQRRKAEGKVYIGPRLERAKKPPVELGWSIRSFG